MLAVFFISLIRDQGLIPIPSLNREPLNVYLYFILL